MTPPSGNNQVLDRPLLPLRRLDSPSALSSLHHINHSRLLHLFYRKQCFCSNRVTQQTHSEGHSEARNLVNAESTTPNKDCPSPCIHGASARPGASASRVDTSVEAGGRGSSCGCTGVWQCVHRAHLGYMVKGFLLAFIPLLSSLRFLAE